MIGYCFTLPRPLFNPACCHSLPERWSEMAVLAGRSQRSVANQLLNQVPWNAVLLKQRHSTVTKCMRRPDRDFELLAERLENLAIHVSVYQRRSILRFEDPPTLSIAKVVLDHLHHFWVHVDFSEACLGLRGHFLMHESAPTNSNDRLLEIDILDVQAGRFTKSHSSRKLEREEDLVLAFSNIDDHVHFLWCEESLFFLGDRWQLDPDICERLSHDQAENLPHVVHGLRCQCSLFL